MLSALALLMVVLTACGSSAAGRPSDEPLEAIGLPVSLYIVTNDDSRVSSGRSVDELIEIGNRAADIWAQAGIRLEITVVGAIDAPADAISAVAVRDGRSFLVAASEGRFAVPSPGVILGFFVRDAGGANGFAPLGSRSFFVSDDPTVDDQRVTSHEIGHILGLHHVGSDADRLMFSGTNGMTLTHEEITVARYVALGILNGGR